MVHVPKPDKCPEHPRYNTECAACHEYATGMDRRRRRLKMYGMWGDDKVKVSSKAPAAQLRVLRAAGMTWSQIREAIEEYVHVPVANDLLYRVAAGQRPRTRKDVADALAQIRPRRRQKSNETDGTGTRRRVQALVAIGYTYQDQARWHEMHRANVRFWARPRTDSGLVTLDTERRVREMYEKYSMIPAPPSRLANCAKAVARRNGWAPPLAWDDDTIDDPEAKPDFGRVDQCLPDEQAVQLALMGQIDKVGRGLNNAEKREVVARATTLGMSSRQIAKLAGISGGAVQKCWDRMREAGEL